MVHLIWDWWVDNYYHKTVVVEKKVCGVDLVRYGSPTPLDNRFQRDAVDYVRVDITMEKTMPPVRHSQMELAAYLEKS